MAEVPHFALPFRFGDGGHAETVEQDTMEDVAACVEAVIRTRPGDRDELPEFGVADPTFGQRPLDAESVVRQASAWEPRASLLAEERPDLLDESVSRMRVTVSREER